MQTITLKVKDGFLPNLIHFLEKFKDEVQITNDKNLEYDPYFFLFPLSKWESRSYK